MPLERGGYSQWTGMGSALRAAQLDALKRHGGDAGDRAPEKAVLSREDAMESGALDSRLRSCPFSLVAAVLGPTWRDFGSAEVGS